MHIPRRCYIGETGKKRLIEHKEEETERTISWYMSRTTWWIAWEAAQVIERDPHHWKLYTELNMATLYELGLW